MYKSFTMLSLIAGLLLAAGQASAAPVTLTGNVPADFLGAGLFYEDYDPDIGHDPTGLLDVGLPYGITSTGCAIIQLAIAYDTLTDTLYVGIDTNGIALDVDGDGDPGVAGNRLRRLGGKDYPNGGVAESFTFSVDFDNDGTFDVISGIDLAGTMPGGYMVKAFAPGGDISTPYYAFGAPIAGVGGSMTYSPSAASPDLEFTITGLKGCYPAFDWTALHMHAFVGSLGDDGIGEDYIEVWAIPEPSAIIIAGVALALLAGVVRKRMAA